MASLACARSLKSFPKALYCCNIPKNSPLSVSSTPLLLFRSRSFRLDTLLFTSAHHASSYQRKPLSEAQRNFLDRAVSPPLRPLNP
jgi:hypothetical protein